MVKAYELVDNNKGVSMSPYVILSQVLLKHKKIEFETVPLTFVEVGPTIKKLTNNEWDLVPAIQFDNGDIIYDSLKIASYLDEKYPSNPILTGSQNSSKLIKEFFDKNSVNHFKLIVLEVYKNCDEVNAKYWKDGREKIIGQTIEEFATNPKLTVKQYIENTSNLVEVLETQDFLDGDKPAINDYTLISHFQNLKTIAPSAYEAVILNHPNPALLTWVGKMHALFDNFLRDRKTL